ncbi:hypothetical protein [Streptomyces broussonetiae]|uniref:hypothetical protein n=1 Tax=Streptomyces broussonetiae TaxID=2686304 RepID=UPI0035D85070
MSPGGHIGISRFSVCPERYQVPSRVIDLSSSRAQAEPARARGRAYGFAVWRNAETWGERVKATLRDTGARPRVGEHTYGLFGVDRRQVAAEDLSFAGQARQLYDHLTCPKTLIEFTAEEGADAHCRAGAQRLALARVYDRLDDTLHHRHTAG